jgi:hypothetical protein
LEGLTYYLRSRELAITLDPARTSVTKLGEAKYRLRWYADLITLVFVVWVVGSDVSL